MSSVQCPVCPHHCQLQEGQTGLCHARKNIHGTMAAENAGRITSLAMDPIEKKPLKHFYPGSMILSAGSYGCNFSCPFCQNSMISQADAMHAGYEQISAEELAHIALSQENNLGIAFTYNEPLISYEYIIDVSRLLKPYGKKTVVVSNGCAADEVLDQVLPYVDAMNIDLKGDRDFYRELSGDFDTVCHTIEKASKICHVEVTTLVIPGKNDSDAFIEKEAQWLSSLDPEIPLHLSRYFPRWHYSIPPTPVETIYRLQKTAQKYLKYVYAGNIW